MNSSRGKENKSLHTIIRGNEKVPTSTLIENKITAKYKKK